MPICHRADLTAMLAAHERSKCAATIGVGAYEVQIPSVPCRKRGPAVALQEKPAVSFLVNRNYVIEPAALGYVPKDGNFR